MMAAKGLYDSEVAPGRTWIVSGMGANVKTVETPSAGGGRGKPLNGHLLFLDPVDRRGWRLPLRRLAAGAGQ